MTEIRLAPMLHAITHYRILPPRDMLATPAVIFLVKRQVAERIVCFLFSVSLADEPGSHPPFLRIWLFTMSSIKIQH